MATARNSLDKLTAGVSTRANLLTYFNSNLDIIDAALAKCNFVGAADPTGDDDDGDGYVVGSMWYNTTGHKIFACEDASTGAALWRQIYPFVESYTGDLSGPAGATDGAIPLYDGATGKLLKDSIYTPTSFAPASGILAAATSFAATAKVLGRKTAGAGAGEECSITEILDLLGTAERGDVLYRGASAWAFLAHGVAGQVLTTGGNGADPSWADATGGAAFWTDMPGTPTRVSDTQFTITDTSNANLYDKAFAKGTVIKWLETTTFCTAMVESASYADNAVTINIIGDSLSEGFTEMKYCIHKAVRLRLPVVPGTLAVADNPSGVYEYMPWDAIKLSIDAFVGTAGTTNATTGHVNDDGTAINSADFSIASTGTSDLGNVCDAPTTVIAAASKLSIDITAVSTTAPTDLYVYLWCYPASWRYME